MVAVLYEKWVQWMVWCVLAQYEERYCYIYIGFTRAWRASRCASH